MTLWSKSRPVIAEEDVKNRGRILVVGDERTARRSVRLVMTEAGYEVIEAEGGAEAIETLEAREQPERLLAVICDLEMSGMDGVETIDLVRTGYPFLPVLVLTGKPDMTLAVSLIKKGIADYILKPFKPDTLKTAVDKAVTAFGCRAADQLFSAQL